ncbi:MAG: methyltransferase domain-containing protein [Myxococcota bacterium]
MTPKLESYYRDHWVEVEPDRMARYEAMFQWREGLEPLIAPANVGEGHIVVDYGCGPGALAVELARRVGPSGKVWALDINREFLKRTQARAEQEGLAQRVSAELVEQDRLPLPDRSADRVVCKNVLEYVADPQVTIREFHRVLRPDGIAHVSDSDWGTLVLEPLGEERVSRLMSAASVAFRTPLIGRSLYGMFRRAGFQDVRVQVLTNPDTVGGMQPVLQNMVSYARASGRVGEPELKAFLADVEQAIEDQTYLALLPQFLVTGHA